MVEAHRSRIRAPTADWWGNSRGTYREASSITAPGAGSSPSLQRQGSFRVESASRSCCRPGHVRP